MTSDIEYLQNLDNPEDDEYTRSLIDLIEVGTLDLELAAFLVAQVRGGASFITGSGPGGIGKTTTMHTLLGFVPGDLPFITALPGETAAIGGPRSCVISNELSDHPPPTYLWGDDLRAFLALGAAGHILVSNVHADNLEEIHGQIVGENGVPQEQFSAINLLVFICLEGGNPPERRIKDTTTRRIINKIYYSDGQQPHRLIYEPATGLSDQAPRNEEEEQNCRAFLAEMVAGKVRRLSQVRQRFLQWNGA
ncbi:MAG: hypothetical protein GKR89_16710 [Candidatus Latescibacteria bacterium]|nr:hypothetical protein [Candidatus Latescibacterota bacterium]